MNKTVLSIFLIAGLVFASGSLVAQADTTASDAEVSARDADSDDDGIDDGTQEGISEGDTSDTDDAEPASYNNSRSNRATSVGPDDADTDDDVDDTERANYNNTRSNRSTVAGPDDADEDEVQPAQDYNAARSNKPSSRSADSDDTDADGRADVRQSAQPEIVDNEKRSLDSGGDGIEDADTERGNADGSRIVPSHVRVILLPPAAPGDDPIEARANEVRAWNEEEKEDFLESVKERAELQSGEDLENFARGILLEQEDVEEIEITDKQVTVRSRVPASLFGIFNASLGATMQVNEAGEVSESLPWYSFLYSKSSRANEVQQALQQEFQSDEEASSADLGLQNEFQITARALEVVLGITASGDAQNHNSSRSRGNSR